MRIFKLDKYSVRTLTIDEDTLLLNPNEPGLPSFKIKPKDSTTAEYVRQAWLRDMVEEQEIYGQRKHKLKQNIFFKNLHLLIMMLHWDTLKMCNFSNNPKIKGV